MSAGGRFHVGGTAGGDRDHRHAHRPAPASCPVGPRSGTTDDVRLIAAAAGAGRDPLVRGEAMLSRRRQGCLLRRQHRRTAAEPSAVHGGPHACPGRLLRTRRSRSGGVDLGVSAPALPRSPNHPRSALHVGGACRGAADADPDHVLSCTTITRPVSRTSPDRLRGLRRPQQRQQGEPSHGRRGGGPAGPAATATPSADEIRQSEQAANAAAAAEATAMPADDASSK